MKKPVKLALALGALLLGAGIVYDLATRASPSAAPPPMVAGQDLKGRPWKLEEHWGKRPVLMNFFSLT